MGSKARTAVLDVSNIAWSSMLSAAVNAPRLDAFEPLIAALRVRGFSRFLGFADGSLVHHLSIQDLSTLSSLLTIRIVRSGLSADGVLLEAARIRGAAVVSLDRFRDWRKGHGALSRWVRKELPQRHIYCTIRRDAGAPIVELLDGPGDGRRR